MSWKKYVHLRPNIESTEAGVESLWGLFFFLFVVVYLTVQLELARYMTTSLYLEDALSTSGLAAAVIDVEVYGIDHRIWVADKELAYKRYCRALRENLNLGENQKSKNPDLIAGPVAVTEFILYNVYGERVEVCERSEGGGFSIYEGTLGEIYAPNNRLIESTGIYSEVSYPVKGLFGCEIQAQKGQLVDIVLRE